MHKIILVLLLCHLVSCVEEDRRRPNPIQIIPPQVIQEVSRNTIASANANTGGCEIDPFESDSGLIKPLLVQSDAFVYPKGIQKNLTFNRKEEVDLTCPGAYLVLSGANTEQDFASAKCEDQDYFIVNATRYRWTDITCSGNLIPTVRDTSKSCQSHGKQLEIGFAYHHSKFVKTIDTCFNKANKTTIYSHYDIIPAINMNNDNPRSEWIYSDRFPKHPYEEVYTKTREKITLNRLLGYPDDYTHVIETGTGTKFLAKGHLTAKCDLFYGPQQDSTFHLENALPQWQSFNTGNWRTHEKNIRDYAEKENIELEIWVGGYNISTYPHKSTGVETELFLYINGTEKKVPIPEYYWKVVYHKESSRGVAFIGYNNVLTTTQPTKFCTDVSSSITWMNWNNKDDIIKGITWACTVADFRKTIKTFPYIKVHELLL